MGFRRWRHIDGTTSLSPIQKRREVCRCARHRRTGGKIAPLQSVGCGRKISLNQSNHVIQTISFPEFYLYGVSATGLCAKHNEVPPPPRKARHGDTVNSRRQTLSYFGWRASQ